MGPGQAQGQEGEEGEREFESRAGFAKYRVNQNQQIIFKKTPTQVAFTEVTSANEPSHQPPAWKSQIYVVLRPLISNICFVSSKSVTRGYKMQVGSNYLSLVSVPCYKVILNIK